MSLRIKLPHKKYPGLQTIGHKIGRSRFEFPIRSNELLVVRFHDQDKLRTVGGIVSMVNEKIQFLDHTLEQINHENEIIIIDDCAPLLSSIESIVQGNLYMGSTHDQNGVIQFFNKLTKHFALLSRGRTCLEN